MGGSDLLGLRSLPVDLLDPVDPRLNPGGTILHCRLCRSRIGVKNTQNTSVVGKNEVLRMSSPIVELVIAQNFAAHLSGWVGLQDRATVWSFVDPKLDKWGQVGKVGKYWKKSKT